MPKTNVLQPTGTRRRQKARLSGGGRKRSVLHAGPDELVHRALELVDGARRLDALGVEVVGVVVVQEPRRPPLAAAAPTRRGLVNGVGLGLRRGRGAQVGEKMGETAVAAHMPDLPGRAR